MLYKRYQYYAKDGIKWTKWFVFDGIQNKYQLGKKLKNEYKESD